jgi:hypothetical protein
MNPKPHGGFLMDIAKQQISRFRADAERRFKQAERHYDQHPGKDSVGGQQTKRVLEFRAAILAVATEHLEALDDSRDPRELVFMDMTEDFNAETPEPTPIVEEDPVEEPAEEPGDQAKPTEDE